MRCEICGEERAATKILTDGVEFRVCERCSRFGKEIRRAPPAPRSSVREPDRDILPGYAGKIRRARESRGMSFKELAKELAVKQTVLEKVERGKMLPDKGLLKKLERFFKIELHGVVSSGESLRKDIPEATLGDLAVVKKR